MLTQLPATVYRELLAELKRIFGKEIVPGDRALIFHTYIYDSLPDCGALLDRKGVDLSVGDNLKECLTLRSVMERALEILQIMRSADSWPEFEKLASKAWAGNRSLSEITADL
jgi:hypothetical protein